MGEHDAQRRAAWRFVRAVVRSQNAGVIGAAVSGLLWQAGAVAAPLMVKQAIDHGVLKRDHGALLVWLGFLLAVGLLEMTAGAVRHLYAIRNRARSDARVRDAIFAHALRLDASYHDRVGPGELMSRASSDSEHVARMMDAIGHMIGYMLTVVAVAIVLLVIDWRLALIVLIPMPVISVSAWAYSRRYHARTERLQESWGETASLVEETVEGIRGAKGLGAGRPRRRSADPRRPRTRGCAGRVACARRRDRIREEHGGRIARATVRPRRRARPARRARHPRAPARGRPARGRPSLRGDVPVHGRGPREHPPRPSR